MVRYPAFLTTSPAAGVSAGNLAEYILAAALRAFTRLRHAAAGVSANLLDSYAPHDADVVRNAG
jgi:hypothetical protein